MSESAQEQVHKAGLYVTSRLTEAGRPRVAAMVALCAHQYGEDAAVRHPEPLTTGVFDVRLRYDGAERGARWNALTDHTDPTLDPAVYKVLDESRSRAEDIVHALVQNWCKYNLAPEATLAILDIANPSWLTGTDYAGALALLFPTVNETRTWLATGAPAMDDIFPLIALRSTHTTVPA
jgi:hypothetical protein